MQLRVAKESSPPAIIETVCQGLVSTVIVAIVIMIEHPSIVIVRPRVWLACGHRVGSRRALVRAGRGHAGCDAGLQQAVDDVLGVVADQEAIPHQPVHRQDNLRLVKSEGGIALLDGETRVVRGDARRTLTGSKAQAQQFDPASLWGRFSLGCEHGLLCGDWRLPACGHSRRFIVARDFHCPIGAMRGGACCAGDADARRFGE